jgi:hypothetical protein
MYNCSVNLTHNTYFSYHLLESLADLHLTLNRQIESLAKLLDVFDEFSRILIGILFHLVKKLFDIGRLRLSLLSH